MKDFSVGLSLVDYIPVIFFLVASVIIQRGLYNKMSKGAFALYATGTIDIVVAGTLKATYKLIYALGICDFEALNNIFFPLQSIGFLFAGIAVIAMLTHKQGEELKLHSVAPAVFSGTFLFVGIMVAGLAAMDYGLARIAVKCKKPGVIALIVLSFICSLAMGYLSSRDFTQAAMNWICEGINIVGQGSLMAAAIVLKKNGLEEMRLSK